MKKLLTLILTAATVFTCTATVFADNSAGGLALSDASHLVLGRESGYIEKLDGTVTVARLAEEFVGGITVLGSDGETKGASDAVASDDIVSCGSDSLKALIYGDVDRNGKVNLSDLVALLKQLAGWEIDICLPAANVAATADGEVDLEDAVKLLRSIAEWDDISLGDVRMVFENAPLTAEAEDSTLELFFTSMMNKRPAQNTESTGELAYKMKLARNESESCQAILVSETDREGLSAELSDFEYEYGGYTLKSKLEWVMYYNTSLIVGDEIKSDHNKNEWEAGNYPEVLLTPAESFELKASTAQHFVISVTSDKSAPAGMYTSVLTVCDSDGNEIKTARVYAYVWDFTLPDAPYSATLFGNGRSTGASSLKAYYDYMLDNNISSYVLPYDISSPKADEYLNDPRVTAFVVDGCDDKYGGLMNCTDEEVKAAWAKLETNPEWMAKHVFYFTDEPGIPDLPKIISTYEHNAELIGTTDFRNMTQVVPFYFSTEDQNKNIDSIERLKDYLNVWCVSSVAYHDRSKGGIWCNFRPIENKYGGWEVRSEALRERGDSIWWYVLNSPEFGYANFFTYYNGCVNRILMWQQYSYRVEALLYYGVGVHWDSISKYEFNIYNGDGVLIYPGEFWGRVGPQASWRLYQVRDGLDDFDYLSIAEELVGRDAVMDVVGSITSNVWTYTTDYRELEAARDAIARLILENK